MLRNCFLPVNYNHSSKSRTCGEIIYRNINELFITCTFCKIKIFEYDEFIGHLKKVHLEDLETNSDCSQQKPTESIQDEEIQSIEIVKSEIVDNSYDNSQLSAERFDEHSDDETKNEEEYFCSDEDQENAIAEDEFEPEESIIRKARKPKALTCGICLKKYADEHRLKMHMKIVHLRKKPYNCEQCNESFAEERLLQSHTANKHTEYYCPTCHKNYSSSRNLKRHMQIHIEVKEFICPEENCSKAFASKGLLRDHQRCHRNEIYICEECGYKCRQRDSLVVHKRHHTGEKPFVCKECDSRFASKPLLKEHMATHETERKHVCDVCGKSFNRPKALYHHKHLHLGIKKFVCKICASAYAQAAGLSAHMRKHRP